MTEADMILETARVMTAQRSDFLQRQIDQLEKRVRALEQAASERRTDTTIPLPPACVIRYPTRG